MEHRARSSEPTVQQVQVQMPDAGDAHVPIRGGEGQVSYVDGHGYGPGRGGSGSGNSNSN